MSNETIILGGGVSGAICAYYIDKSILITESLGGQIEAKFPMGPRYLHKKIEIHNLLKELNLSLDTKSIKVGYYINGEYIDKINDKLKAEYYSKSRGLTSINKYPDSVLSDGLNNFEVFSIDMKDFYRAIISRISHNRIINKKIEKIDIFNKVLFSNNEFFKYRKLINTIPKDVFLSMCGNFYIGKFFNPITYLFVKSDFDLLGYDYVYFPEMSTSKFHRITKIENGLVFDFAGVLLRSEVLYEAEKFMGTKFEISEMSKNMRAQIIGNDTTSDFEHIVHIGRFAELDHSIKVEDVIKHARQIKNNI